MPVMNGLDAAREISKIAPGMPMIMFTMFESGHLVEAALKVGIKHVFSKSDGFGDHVFTAMLAMLQQGAKQNYAGN
jgi:DNA-binding NarL/FixJ family response regulator